MGTQNCPSCGSQLHVPDHAVGRRLMCPNCGKNFTASARSIQAHQEFRPREVRPGAFRPESREAERLEMLTSADALRPAERFPEEPEERPRSLARTASFVLLIGGMTVGGVIFWYFGASFKRAFLAAAIISLGLYVVVSSLSNWSWHWNNARVQHFVQKLGRTRTRLVQFLFGLFCVLSGFWLALSSIARNWP